MNFYLFSLFVENSQDISEDSFAIFENIPDYFMLFFILVAIFHFLFTFYLHYTKKDREEKVFTFDRNIMFGCSCLLPVFTYIGILNFTNYSKWKAFIVVFACFFIKRILNDFYYFFFSKDIQ